MRRLRWLPNVDWSGGSDAGGEGVCCLFLTFFPVDDLPDDMCHGLLDVEDLSTSG